MGRFISVLEKYKSNLLRTVPVFIYALAFAVFGVFIGVISGNFVFEKLFSVDLNLPKVEKKKKLKISKRVDYSGIDKVFGVLEDNGNSDFAGDTERRESDIKVEDLKVLGTLIAGRVRYAVVEVGGERRIVREGERLGDVSIIKVEKFFVEIERNGRIFKMPLFGKGSAGKDKRRERPVKPPFTDTTPAAPKVVKLDRAMVERETADIGKLLKDVAILPVLRGGRTIGYKFARIKRGSILRKIGLKPGDIILSVNDVPVTTVDDTFKIYNILRNEDTVKVELERRGHREVIIYEIR